MNAMNGSKASWVDGVQRIHDEAHGLLTMDVVRQGDVPGLIGAAMAGDADAARLVVLVNDCVTRIQSAPAKHPMECARCAKPLRAGRFAIVIASASRDDARQGLGMAICQRCGPSPGAIQAAAVQALRLIWPDGRAIDITHLAAGHA